MAGVFNMAPQLFKGVIAGEPLVDIITGIHEASMTNTTYHDRELGRPAQKEHYDYMLSYAPYENIETKSYPHLLVTAGYHDSQVQYWRPAKWVAKLRAHKTDHNLLLLRTNMEAGHAGTSGRYERAREGAFEYAFLLKLAGLGE